MLTGKCKKAPPFGGAGKAVKALPERVKKQARKAHRPSGLALLAMRCAHLRLLYSWQAVS
ncbi:hypothetical protein FAEPRAA2165_01430 [Faecalibacterium duncaniae]|uniref:Uncharacterized protein n=1 Tax=Faecalibacterium duncaniae (strain DSM 17677 / JCM 31915 / A2-165) TaxID=411483 RepID=C7H560_FAED2|nr:hypothetical protein FAEPRAA2165_01430 [Faecalibacterium duncaniae]